MAQIWQKCECHCIELFCDPWSRFVLLVAKVVRPYSTLGSKIIHLWICFLFFKIVKDFTPYTCIKSQALSPYFFALTIDELIARVQVEMPLYILFANNTILVDESRNSVNAKLERW
eukprot:TRINITY_DN1313_c1_g1_i1.p1 TRINITY_DN1313_c1_g1~~TRINITY_DN1313_c1_g1_i1.p1  ORF type:complete len:116 (+),score=4.12 TRINITY_DN1313_c1_g1_i1:961-1308(+)